MLGWQNIALYPLSHIAMPPQSAWNSSANLVDVGSVEMVHSVWFPVAVEWDSSWDLVGVAVAYYSFAPVSVPSNSPVYSCSDLVRICSVEVIASLWFPVAVKWDRARYSIRLKVALYSLGDVAMSARLSSPCGSYFVGIRSVEVVDLSGSPVTIQRNFAGRYRNVL